MNLDVDSQMRLAALAGVKEFTPVYRGLELKIENTTPGNSEYNLKRLFEAGFTVVAIRVENGQPIFVSSDGATYLATGFALGQGARDSRTTAFARIVARVFGGTVEEWLPAICEHWPTNFTGPIVAADRPSSSMPRVFQPE